MKASQSRQLEARHTLGVVGEDFGEDLEGHVAVQARIAGAVAASPNLFDDLTVDVLG